MSEVSETRVKPNFTHTTKPSETSQEKRWVSLQISHTTVYRKSIGSLSIDNPRSTQPTCWSKGLDRAAKLGNRATDG